MHILIAPNAFKNSLSAEDAALAVKQGLQMSKLKCTVTCFPIADGGDGTGSLIIKQCKGKVIKKEVHHPFGTKIMSQFGLIDNGKTAVVEMADASGLRLLNKDELNPMLASSAGTGELISFALDEGVNKIIIAMGGSATVDGGCGILAALGARFFDRADNLLQPVPQGLANLARIDISQLDERVFDCEIIVLCDVNNKLLGPDGSAAIFGPQKGAGPEEVARLEKFLVNLDDITGKQAGKRLSAMKYGGTAGGAAAGLSAFLNAKLVNGIGYFLQVTGFDAVLKKSNLLITAEGSIDMQTLQGKGPFGVAELAKKNDIPVIGLAGLIPLTENIELNKYFDILLAIGNGAEDLPEALKHTRVNLVRTARVIGDLLSMKK
ncbi:glycerate kinase [Mucilaginibacter gotjawali]|uniref:Glycerate kinase n=2 Tax=Mucilaginibacter gotjawali TaxID=1550579 RepID=A0A0X8X1B5_9SPHI|nr:glycerate kinase [Mucilaginibacter gotjawali]MBB3053740.1 glycerate kinase [Mucilaginibacter gotjawali]BAU54000.1 Glycerate kinase [Mucilaginibacter gotjawali]